MTRVKVCGITRLEDALAAIDLGVDALGFNFCTGSPRYVSVRQASKILEKLPPFVSRIGVVVNFRTVRDLRRLSEVLHLDGIQLHGDESVELVRSLKPIQVIKAFRVSPEFRVTALRNHPASAILLDGFEPGKFGGTGKVFDWSMAQEAARFHRIIVSGGLNPGNVREAIRQAHPYAVDVASGVEASPGKKDIRKIKQFMAAVRGSVRISL